MKPGTGIVNPSRAPCGQRGGNCVVVVAAAPVEVVVELDVDGVLDEYVDTVDVEV